MVASWVLFVCLLGFIICLFFFPTDLLVIFIHFKPKPVSGRLDLVSLKFSVYIFHTFKGIIFCPYFVQNHGHLGSYQRYLFIRLSKWYLHSITSTKACFLYLKPFYNLINCVILVHFQPQHHRIVSQCKNLPILILNP